VRGEGRTSISIGLGIALASEYGRRTLVLDLDLEHQDCAHRLGIPRGDGLWGILAGRSSAPDVLHEVGGGLWAIRAGMFSGSASRMASAIAETGVIDEIAADFDVLVADLPPVLTPVGPQLIDLFGSTLLVARSASTSGRLVRRAMEHLPSEAAVLVNGAHSDLPMWIRRIVDR
jgi:MinD-like ATPase involved in chromosome partitioning or flagellar assembly